MNAAREQGLQAYIHFYEHLEPLSVARLETLVTENVVFRDPFNDVCGPAAYSKVLDDLFERCSKPRFRVEHYWLSGAAAALKWRFEFLSDSKSSTPVVISGMSELRLNEEGLVESHIDHWDAASQLYNRIPLLGRILAIVRNRLQAPQ